MEKTVQITIASTQFQVTETAYDTLRSYLDRLKAHFGDTPDGLEVLRDIESRIAEKFLEARHKLVTDKDVAAVIAEIGDASAFSDDAGDGSESTTETPKDVPSRKRLYRDTDNAYLGGVASGIAAYFNIDPLWLRLAFLASIFFGGTGIVIYLILWLLIPEAKNASQKLEMSGKPVNLDTIAGVVKERFEEAEKSGAIARGTRAISEIVRTLFGYVGTIIGAFLSIGSFFAIIGASVLVGIVALNWNASWNDIPHKEAISPALLKTALLFGYTAAVIPLVLIFSLGYRWMTHRTILASVVGFGLIGVWALSLVGSGVLATKIVGDYYAFTASHPDYARSVDERKLEAFDTIFVERSHVTIVQGTEYSVRVEGRAMDMQNVSVSVATGTLTVRAAERNTEPCFFCNSSNPSVTVTVPSVEKISVQSGGISFENLKSDALMLEMDSSNMNGAVTSDTLSIVSRSSSARLSIAAQTLALDIENGRISMDGDIVSANITSKSTSVDARELVVDHATVDARSSYLDLNITGELTVENDISSRIQNAGTKVGVSEKDEGEI